MYNRARYFDDRSFEPRIQWQSIQFEQWKCDGWHDDSANSERKPILDSTWVIFHWPSIEVRKTVRNSHKCMHQFLTWISIWNTHRFPCTDLRPIHTPDRVPWWKRNVLRDSLYITFHEAKLSYQSNRYEIVANKIDIYYSVSCERTDKSEATHIPKTINEMHVLFFYVFFSSCSISKHSGKRRWTKDSHWKCGDKWAIGEKTRTTYCWKS